MMLSFNFSALGRPLICMLCLGFAESVVASEHGEHAKQEVGIVTEAEQLLMPPGAALERLSQGNERFVAGHRVERDWQDQVHDTARGQYPFASIVSCMDSRTAVEQIFDLGFGDVFSIRLAGNVIDEDVLGSLEYAHKVAGAKLIVVLGHSHCGAMKGAVDDVVLGNLTNLLARVKPAVVGVADDGTPRTSANAKFVDKVGHLNVILMVRMIREETGVSIAATPAAAPNLANMRKQLEAANLQPKGAA